MKLHFKIPISENDSVANAVMKVVDFVGLEPGWHFGEGTSVDDGAIANAIVVLNAGASADAKVKADVFPGLDGEVRVCFYRDADYFEFTIDRNNRIDFLRERSGDEVESVQKLTLDDAMRKIASDLTPKWNSSAFYHLSYGTRILIDSKAWGLSRAATNPAESRSLKKGVLVPRAHRSVRISGASINPFRGSLQFTGKYQNFPIPAV